MVAALGLRLLRGYKVKVMTAPPFNAETFPYTELAEVDVVYIRLHGIPDQPYLYDGGWNTAFSMDRLVHQVKELPKHPRIFMEGCFGKQTGIPAVLLKLGASEVVASTTETRNRPLTIGDAGKIGLAMLKAWLDGAGESGPLQVADNDVNQFEVMEA